MGNVGGRIGDGKITCEPLYFSCIGKKKGPKQQAVGLKDGMSLHGNLDGLSVSAIQAGPDTGG